MRYSTERGIAMITTLLVMMLISAVLVGFTAVVMSDQRYRFIDRDRGQAFYAAAGAIEKLTADLGNTFFKNVAPTAAQITALTAAPPAITGVTYAAPAAPTPLPSSSLSAYDCTAAPPVTVPVTPPKETVIVGTNGYTITFCRIIGGNGSPTSTTTKPVKSGPYEGLIAMQTPYQLDVTARTSTGGEVHLIRTMEAVAIPVFQFGMFSDVDLSFFAGPNFNFGGRVHTNGNLFLAQGAGATLTLNDRVTAVGQVVRQRLQNNVVIGTNNSTGTVSLAKAPNVFRTMLVTEGSVVDGVYPAPSPASYPSNPPFNEPLWTTVSLSYYNAWLRNGKTGAKNLSLPLTTAGGSNPDLVRRPLVGEDVSNAILYNERLYTKASLRIQLSDKAADITSLPGATPGAPILLEGDWNTPFAAGVGGAPAGYGPITVAGPPTTTNYRLPLALSPGARVGTVNASGGAAPNATITFTTAAEAQMFKSKFVLCAGAPCATVAGNPIITCDVRTNTQLQTCTNVPIMVAGFLTSLSPAGGLSGITVPITAPTVLAAGPITVAATTPFNPSPFWDTFTSAAVPQPTLIECRGNYTATQLTGCSAVIAAPFASHIMVSGAMSDAGISTIGGFIKIDRQNVDGTWSDVTLEILSYGIGDTNSVAISDPDNQCAVQPSPNAIVRLERLRGNSLGAVACDYVTDATGAKDPTNWWPLALFDAREGQVRDPAINPFTVALGGVMYYVNLDVGNLTKWFKHNTAPFNVAASTGNLASVSGTGYTVYFSDRRGNRDANLLETGEFGWEDFVNPLSATGQPNGTLDTGEDLNGNGTLEVYGNVPHYTPAATGIPVVGVPPCNIPQPCGAGGVYANPLTGGYVLGTAVLGATLNAAPLTIASTMVAKVNRSVLFRRALMVSNAKHFGGTGVNGVAADRLTGLTVVSENPVYVNGDWNADSPVASGFGGANNAATSVIADAVTLLSNNWSDANSFGTNGPPGAAAPRSGYDVTAATGVRPRSAQSWYRLAIIGGKGAAFNQPAVGGVAADFGTDGGAHNFLRFLEHQVAGTETVNYLGAIATFFYNRQAVGTYKCCNNVYSPPVRAFAFDQLFLNPALLPPNAPVFRDMNAVGFSQELRPGR